MWCSHWSYLFSFLAGFSSGNRFTSFIYNVTNISNIHLWMFDNQDVGGSSGIWYTQWEHWQMDFALKVEPCPNCTSPDCGGKTCYFGTCGIDGECQCLSGYSGSNCSTSKLSLSPKLVYYWHISLKPCSFTLEEESCRPPYRMEFCKKLKVIAVFITLLSFYIFNMHMSIIYWAPLSLNVPEQFASIFCHIHLWLWRAMKR